jgi:Carbohydrate family 9 binding domain-like
MIVGNLGEWILTPYQVVAVTYGQANYQGPSDLSATLMLGWDQSFLYLVLRIQDDKYVQNASGDQIFKGDHVEVLLDRDLNGDFSNNQLNVDDYQLGLSLGSDLKSPTNYLWYPRESQGIKSGILLAGIATANGYTSEAAIPWRLFQVEPKLGDIFGFAVSVSDNDQVNKNVQETMVSTAPDRQLSDPTTWGNLYLIRP